MEIYALNVYLTRLILAQTNMEIDELVKELVHVVKPNEETLDVIKRATQVRRQHIVERDAPTSKIHDQPPDDYYDAHGL